MATVATGAGIRPDVTLKLSQLQNLVKRDPEGHRSDYDAQIRRLQSECHILSLNPSSKPPTHLSELIQFAAAVSSSSYDQETIDSVANLLVCLLLGKSHENVEEDHFKSLDALTLPSSALILHKEVRKSCVSALILMRNKGKIPPLRLLELFYRVMAVIADKGLRIQLYKHIVNDIRNINKKGKRDETVNRSVQAFLHKVVGATVKRSKDSSSDNSEADDSIKFATKRAVDMTAELYRRKVWTDERTVAIMATAVESKIANVAAAAMRFFLNIEEKIADDEDKEANDEFFGVQDVDFHQHSAKTKVSISVAVFIYFAFRFI
jgi:protein SDA1